MTRHTLCTDEEIKELAAEIIKDVAGSIIRDSRIVMREHGDRIEFAIGTTGSPTYICYSPQDRVEQILREIEEWAIKVFADEEPGQTNDTVYSYMNLAYEHQEIKSLIEQIPLHFCSISAALEQSTQQIFALAKKRQEAAERKFKELEDNFAKCKEFAQKVEAAWPLWKYVLKFFDARGDLDGIYQDEKYIQLAGNYKIPRALGNELYERASHKQSNIKIGRGLDPLGFAMKQVGLNMKLGIKYEALLKIYYMGQKILRDEGKLLA